MHMHFHDPLVALQLFIADSRRVLEPFLLRLEEKALAGTVQLRLSYISLTAAGCTLKVDWAWSHHMCVLAAFIRLESTPSRMSRGRASAVLLCLACFGLATAAIPSTLTLNERDTCFGALVSLKACHADLPHSDIQQRCCIPFRALEGLDCFW